MDAQMLKDLIKLSQRLALVSRKEQQFQNVRGWEVRPALIVGDEDLAQLLVDGLPMLIDAYLVSQGAVDLALTYLGQVEGKYPPSVEFDELKSKLQQALGQKAATGRQAKLERILAILQEIRERGGLLPAAILAELDQLDKSL
jgi:hypothetical protein